jgi:hypothetical protein
MDFMVMELSFKTNRKIFAIQGLAEELKESTEALNL